MLYHHNYMIKILIKIKNHVFLQLFGFYWSNIKKITGSHVIKLRLHNVYNISVK